MFKIFNENNEIVECEVLHMFSKDGKDYIVYVDNEGDVLASFYEIKDNRLIISKITDDLDFDIVDKELELINYDRVN